MKTIDEVMEAVDDFCAADRAGCGVCEGICECREQDRDDLRAAIEAYAAAKVAEEREACATLCDELGAVGERVLRVEADGTKHVEYTDVPDAIRARSALAGKAAP